MGRLSSSPPCGRSNSSSPTWLQARSSTRLPWGLRTRTAQRGSTCGGWRSHCSPDGTCCSRRWTALGSLRCGRRGRILSWLTLRRSDSTTPRSCADACPSWPAWWGCRSARSARPGLPPTRRCGRGCDSPTSSRRVCCGRGPRGWRGCGRRLCGPPASASRGRRRQGRYRVRHYLCRSYFAVISRAQVEPVDERTLRPIARGLRGTAGERRVQLAGESRRGGDGFEGLTLGDGDRRAGHRLPGTGTLGAEVGVPLGAHSDLDVTAGLVLVGGGVVGPGGAGVGPRERLSAVAKVPGELCGRDPDVDVDTENPGGEGVFGRVGVDDGLGVYEHPGAVGLNLDRAGVDQQCLNLFGGDDQWRGLGLTWAARFRVAVGDPVERAVRIGTDVTGLVDAVDIPDPGEAGFAVTR